MRSLFFEPFFSDVFMESLLSDRKVPSILQSLLRRHSAEEISSGVAKCRLFSQANIGYHFGTFRYTNSIMDITTLNMIYDIIRNSRVKFFCSWGFSHIVWLDVGHENHPQHNNPSLLMFCEITQSFKNFQRKACKLLWQLCQKKHVFWQLSLFLDFLP